MNATAPTVLVLGAAGRFGTAAALAFHAAGWRVLAQARRPLSYAAAANGGSAHASQNAIATLELPLRDTAALAAAAAGAQVVVYGVNPLYTRWNEEMLPLARLGMDVAERLGGGATFLLPGNVYNFGESMPARLDEAAPERPSTPKGRLRVALEAELRQRAEAGRLRGIVLRAGDFYGAGSGSWLDQLIVKSMAAGKLVYPGPLDVPHAWAYLPDLARAAVALAQRPAPAAAFERFHFEGHTLTGRELLAHIDAAAAGLGLRPARGFRVTGMPWRLLRMVGLVHPMLRELTRMSYLWRVPHALDGRELGRVIGTLPMTPPAQALRQALVDLGDLVRPRGARSRVGTAANAV